MKKRMESTLFLYYKVIINFKKFFKLPYKKILIQMYDQYLSLDQFKRYYNNFKNIIKIVLNELLQQLIILYNIFVVYINDVKFGVKYTFNYIKKYGYLIFDTVWFFTIGNLLQKMIINKYLYKQNKLMNQTEKILDKLKTDPKMIQDTIKNFTPNTFFEFIQNNIRYNNEIYTLDFINELLYTLQKENFYDENKWFQNFYFNFYKTHIDDIKSIKDLFLSLDLFIKFHSSKEQKNYLDTDFELPIYTIDVSNYSKVKDYIEQNIVDIKLDDNYRLKDIHYIQKDFSKYYLFEIQTDNNGFYQIPKLRSIQNNKYIIYDYKKNNIPLKNIMVEEQKNKEKVIKIFNTKVMMGNYKRPVKIYGILKIDNPL